jgi:hypothetical protein
MAVTKQVYTATATWTASQLATIFESAFVASGLMTAWYDSFTSGSVENRILEVVYDGGATYGTTYYWFQFTTTEARLAITATWDSGSHVPTGTQYLDYFTTTTNSVFGDRIHDFGGLSATSDVDLIRYTSATDTTQSWYVIRQGANSRAFTIAPGSFTLSPWIDLDKTLFHLYLKAGCRTDGYLSGVVQFASTGALRRSYVTGSALAGETGGYPYINSTVITAAYASFGRGNPSFISNMNYVGGTTWSGGFGSGACVIVPNGFSAANPAYSSNFSPVFTQMPFSAYISTPHLASDFGIAFHYANNTMVRGDKLIVTASVEEWEILAVNNNSTVTSGASPMFLARVV